MTTIKGKYWNFYLMGREVSRLPEGPDLEDGDRIEKMVSDGGILRDLVHDACTADVISWGTPRRRREWDRDNENDIEATGGDKEAAWSAYLAGVADELCAKVEAEALEVLAGVLDSGEAGEDEGDDD